MEPVRRLPNRKRNRMSGMMYISAIFSLFPGRARLPVRWGSLVIGALMLCGMWSSLAVAGDAPQYRVVPYEHLCPAAANPNVYSSGFLKHTKMLVQGKDGWLFITERQLIETFGPDAQAVAALKRFVDRMQSVYGTRIVLVYPPSRALVEKDRLPKELPVPFDYDYARYNYAGALTHFRQADMIVPDLLPLLNEPSTEKPFYFKRDDHWTPYGARRTARIVAARIRQMPVYADLPKTKFVTRPDGMLGKRGVLQKAARRICGTAWPDQYIQGFKTEQVEADDSSNSLFGNDSLPPITLVGTSFSNGAMNYNFAGFLKQFLSVDILNVGIAGGSYDGSIIHYLMSKEFRSSPPKILIWELPSYHYLRDAVFPRELLPLVTDGCNGKPAVMTKTVQLKPGNNEVLYNGGGQFRELRSRNLVADLQFSDPSFKQLKAHVWYINGRYDSVKIQYTDHTDSTGRFVFQLRNDGDWADMRFLAMNIELAPDQKPTSVTARLCRRSKLSVAQSDQRKP